MSKIKDKKITYADAVSNKIIEALEAGVAPWQKPWSGTELYKTYPINAKSRNEYNGINSVNLILESQIKGYSDNRWLTYKQALDLGATVNKGEKGTLIQFWKYKEEKDVVDENGKVIGKETLKLENPKVFYSTVFNAQQTTLQPLEQEQLPQIDFNPNDMAEKILKNSGADIRESGSDRAYYMPTHDYIQLPLREQFNSAAEFYSTALHELGHWTGHKTRLDRDLSGGFGSESYAREELRAEISSFMMSQRLGIDFDPSNHYSYVDSWIKVLREDNKEIFRASRDAEKITNYVEGLSMEKEQNIKAEHEVVRGTLYIFDTQTREKLVSLDIDEIYRSDELSPDFFIKDLKNEFQGLIDNLKEQNIYLNNEETALKDILDYAKEFLPQEKAQEQNIDVQTKFVLFDPITLKNVAIGNTLEDLKQEYLTLSQNDFFKDMDILIYEMKQNESGKWIANYDKKLDVDWNNFEKAIKEQLSKQTYLYVPKEEKEAAKSVGCRWDAENKAWYAPKGTELQKVSEWTLDNQQFKNGISEYVTTGGSNPIVSFKDELEKRGFELRGELVANGRIQSVHIHGHDNSTRNGRYAIHEDGVPTLWLKDWKTGIEETIKHKDSHFKAGADDKTIETQKEINRIKNLQSVYDKDRMHYAVAKRLEAEISNLSPATADNFYLAKKGIEPTAGVKVDGYGNLVIPFHDVGGSIKTAQKIILQEDGTYLKLFEKGGEKNGNFHGIEYDPYYTNPDTVIFCEGYATGASINQATGYGVLVTGDSGNLKSVMENYLDVQKNNIKTIIVAADNDIYRGSDKNVGLIKANEAVAFIAEKYPDLKNKIAIAIPSFTSDEIKNKATDFNDIHKSRGLEAVSNQIDIAIKKLDIGLAKEAISKEVDKKQGIGR